MGGRAQARNEFVNTWSVEGFLSEGLQPAELGWGTHERKVPPEATFHDHGCRAAIFLTRPGATTRVRSWTPNAGPIQGYLITHNESISIADYLSIEENGEAIYRPTVHYAYHPCDDTILSLHELQGTQPAAHPACADERRDRRRHGRAGRAPLRARPNAYWYGSQLTIHEARALAPYQNATGLQVSSAVVAGE